MLTAPLLVFVAAAVLVGALLAFFLTLTYQQAEHAAATASRNEATILVTRIEATLRRVKPIFYTMLDELSFNQQVAKRAPA